MTELIRLRGEVGAARVILAELVGQAYDPQRCRYCEQRIYEYAQDWTDLQRTGDHAEDCPVALAEEWLAQREQAKGA